MAELALYRKYRSADFTEVLGQDHIVSTLTQAIAAGRISHAYLFTGPRGTGKTSVARLLAKSLNGNDSALDIIEIDAASNRSIDAVRDLRDRINLAPSVGKYKVYIVDEVHMLTTEAFNALLKTLEEPPAHAVFILATTEVHKVPETIMSRTQRFSFKPIPASTIVERLEVIAAAEGLTAERPALELIAKVARGGFRDAISLLDQVGSGTKQVTVDGVEAILGYGDSQALTELAQAIIDGQTKEALQILDKFTGAGVQPGQLINQMTEWWRHLLMLAVGSQQSSDPVLNKLAASVPVAQITAALDILLEASRSHWAALSLEIAVVKLSSTTAAVAAPAPRAASIARPAASSTAAAPAPKEASAAPCDSPSPDLWPKALLAVKGQNNSLYALLRSCRIEFDGGTLVLWSKFNFHKDRLVEAKNRLVIETALQKVYGRPVPISCQVDTKATAAREAATANPTADLVSSALEILGGEVME